jgi:hypothetical protein
VEVVKPNPVGIQDLPIIFWILLFVLLFSQGTWIFLDARKREANPWGWGLWGCTHFPTPLVVYWLVKRGGWQTLKKWMERRRSGG